MQCNFNQNPSRVLCGTWLVNSKFIWKSKGHKMAKMPLKKKYTMWGLSHSDMKTYLKTVEIKIPWFYHSNRRKDMLQRTKPIHCGSSKMVHCRDRLADQRSKGGLIYQSVSRWCCNNWSFLWEKDIICSPLHGIRRNNDYMLGRALESENQNVKSFRRAYRRMNVWVMRGPEPPKTNMHTP